MARIPGIESLGPRTAASPAGMPRANTPVVDNSMGQLLGQVGQALDAKIQQDRKEQESLDYKLALNEFEKARQQAMFDVEQMQDYGSRESVFNKNMESVYKQTLSRVPEDFRGDFEVSTQQAITASSFKVKRDAHEAINSVKRGQYYNARQDLNNAFADGTINEEQYYNNRNALAADAPSIGIDPERAVVDSARDDQVAAVGRIALMSPEEVRQLSSSKPTGIFANIDRVAYVSAIDKRMDEVYRIEASEKIKENIDASSAEINQLVVENSDNPHIMKLSQDMIKNRMENPLQYAAMTDYVQQAGELYKENPRDPEAQATYFGAIEQFYNKSGIPSYAREYISKDQLKALESTVRDPNTSGEQLVQKASTMMMSFPESMHGTIARELATVDPNIPNLVMMKDGSDKLLFANALKTSEKERESLLPPSYDKTDFDMSVKEKMADYTNAALLVGMGSNDVVASKMSSIEILAKQYMSRDQNLSQDKAIDKAIDTFLPFDVYDTVVIDKVHDARAVHRYLSRALPSAVEGITVSQVPGVQGEANIEQLIETGAIKPIVQKDINGNYVGRYVYQNTGDLLLDEDLVQVDSVTGSPVNVEQAAVTVPLDDMLQFSAMPTPIAPDALANKIAATGLVKGKVITELYSRRNNSYMSSRPIVNIKIKTGGFGSKPIIIDSKEEFESLPDSDKKRAKEAIKKNVEYNRSIMSSVDKDRLDSFKASIEQSNENTKKWKARSRIMKEKGADALPAWAKEISAFDYYATSLGYNYLEVPEWAK